MKHILGISRSTVYSPNSTDRDSAIFTAVTSRLERMGHDVSIINEDLFFAADLSDFDLVFSMARGHDVLNKLAHFEHEHPGRVINSAIVLSQNTRADIAKTLQANNIAMPHVAIASPNELLKTPQSYPIWLKRADACAQKADDICYIDNESSYHDALNSFVSKGIDMVIAEEHLAGDLIKFYGIQGTDFFYITYPTENKTFSKFGLEATNDAIKHYNFEMSKFKETADNAARCLGIVVYGGDAVVGNDGKCRIIDFNDWPSFAPCRKEAAKTIAYKINNIILTLQDISK